MTAPLDEEERALVERLADAVVRRGMTVPAVLFLEMSRPLSFVTSQAMVFFAPMVGVLFPLTDYERVSLLLERREGVAQLIAAIEARDESRPR